MIFFISGLLLACAQEGREKADPNRQKMQVVGNDGVATSSKSCSDGGNTVGLITPEGSDEVKQFVSTTVQPSSIGEIKKVEMYLRIKIKNNQISPAESLIKIAVSDSYVGQKDNKGAIIKPIYVSINSATNGSYNSQTGELSIQFSDQYGTLMLAGKTDSQKNGEFRGKIQFRNLKSVDGQSPRSGNLGQFSIASCGVFF